MNGPHVIMVTHPDEKGARALARDLVERRLVACVQVLRGIGSTYRWRGRIEEAEELLLLMKTWEDRLEPLRRRILALHPYELPQMVAMPLVWGHGPYLDWVREETRPETAEGPPSSREPGGRSPE